MEGGKFWEQPAGDALFSLGADPGGLAQSDAARRLLQYGPNELVAAKRTRLIFDFLRRLANPLVAILLFASAVAGATGDLVSFVIIVSMVMLSTLLDLVQERRAVATVEALKRSIALTARVLRDGQSREIAVAELVPGDVVLLSAGDLVPADGLVLQSNAAQVNQALLTGEPYPVEKRVEGEAGTTIADAPNALLHGSSMVGGTATSYADHGKVLLMRERPEHLDHACAVLAVEIAGRFIAQDEIGVIGQRPRDRHALTFASRQTVRRLPVLASKACRVEQCHRAGFPGRAVEPPKPPDWHHHVLERAELGEQEVELEDESEMGEAQARPGVAIECRHVLPLEEQLTGRRPIDQAEQIEQ